jgi:hypothetical protein
MNGNVPTVAEVIAEAKNARRRLADLELQLQDGIDEIDFTIFKERRDPLAAELAKRKELISTQAEVRTQFTVLAFVTAQRLDDTDEVKQMVRRMNTINAGLRDDLDRLKRIERYAATAAKVADATAKTAAKLAAIAAKGLS